MNPDKTQTRPSLEIFGRIGQSEIDLALEFVDARDEDTHFIADRESFA